MPPITSGNTYRIDRDPDGLYIGHGENTGLVLIRDGDRHEIPWGTVVKASEIGPPMQAQGNGPPQVAMRILQNLPDSQVTEVT